MSERHHTRKRKPILTGWIGVERVMLAYSLLSLVIMGIVQGWGAVVVAPLLYRVAIIGITAVLWLLYRRYPLRVLYVVRVGFQLALLGYWYPDIYNCVSRMQNYDHVFAALDQWLFGFQPAIEFQKVLSGRVWSELFYMGYFSYYLMLVALMVVSLLAGVRRFNRNANIILLSFCMFYVVFLFLQVSGPQFYFPVIGYDNAAAGVFPPVYDYFAHYPELNHSSEPTGLFMSLVQSAQGSERPIAAFPSSHVGVSTVFLLLAYKTRKSLFAVFIPFYLFLVFSTVYIQAHYAIDAIVGLPAGVLAYLLAHRLSAHPLLRLPDKFGQHHRRART